MDEIIKFKNFDFCKPLRLPISPILKIQKFPLGMLILKNSTTGNAIISTQEIKFLTHPLRHVCASREF